MKKIRLGSNFTIFLLFFGIAAIDAFQSGQWLKSLFWVAIGTVFLLSDKLRSKKAQKETDFPTY
jgi:hypothetical protein